MVGLSGVLGMKCPRCLYNGCILAESCINCGYVAYEPIPEPLLATMESDHRRKDGLRKVAREPMPEKRANRIKNGVR